MIHGKLIASVVLLLVALLAQGTVAAQPGAPAAAGQSEAKPFNLVDGLGGLDPLGGAGLPGAAEITLSGTLRVEQGGRDGVLEIKAVMGPGWHTYALDQQGGPGPGKLTVNAAGQLEVRGAFQPNRPPRVRSVKEFNVPLREHYDEVLWTAPVRLADGVDPRTVHPAVTYDGLLCHDVSGCKPAFGQRVEVSFGGYYQASPPTKPVPAPATPGTYRAERSHAAFSGHVEPGLVAPGGTLKLVLNAVPDAGWHIYAYEPRDPQQIAKPTLIAVTEPAGWKLGPVTASANPVVKLALTDDPPVRYHSGPVTWTVEVTVPRDVPPGDVRLAGIVGYQNCTDTACDAPTAARFTVDVSVGSHVGDERRPLAFSAARYGEAAKLAAAGGSADSPPGPGGPLSPPEPRSVGGLDLANLKTAGESDRPLSAILVLAFLGGFILNFMPCVLPVIGLKIMSFVQQSGESRGRVFLLNLWYVLGLLSVFMLLATGVAMFQLGWGEQLSSEAFVVTMSAVVFAMGLSFLGVWEIPIPGFAGGATASELADREGPAGAFFKGVITTLLATPCSGPGLATAVAWSANKPSPLIYLVFFALGLGMAFPYVVLGANPKLVRFLPRPGAWMETFKQAMGLVLFGAVVFLLTTIHWSSVMPAVAVLFGVWAGCWWIGRTPLTAEWQTRLRAWVGAAGFIVLVCAYAFSSRFGFGDFSIPGLRGTMDYRLAAYVDRLVEKRIAEAGGQAPAAPQTQKSEDHAELPWEPFSTEKLKRLTAENKTVLVDFTADWCLTCKFLEGTVLNTAAVRQAVHENGVVTLVANWTDRDPEISSLLEALGTGKQVPVVAIFPAGRPNEPIVLKGGYTKGTLLERIKEAGASRG